MTRYLRITLLAAIGLGLTGLFLAAPSSSPVVEGNAAVVRTWETGPEGLLRFDELALADADTQLLEGDPGKGSAVYVTQTRGLLFLADTYYTYASFENGVLTLSTPSAFRRTQVEANRERLDFWVAYLKENGN